MLQVEIQYTKAADKFFLRHEDVRERYEEAIRTLVTGDRPEQVDVKRVPGKYHAYYRIRIGGYRVVYTIINNKIVVVYTLLAGSGAMYTRKCRA